MKDYEKMWKEMRHALAGYIGASLKSSPIMLLSSVIFAVIYESIEDNQHLEGDEFSICVVNTMTERFKELEIL